MEVHQLRYFLAVCETENFTQAAKRCYVSQPSLSQQIKKLEDELGQALFDRRWRAVTLTPAGRALRERAEKILAAIDETAERFRDWEDSGEGEVRIGAIPTVAPYVLPVVVERFLAEFPRAECVVQEDVTDQLVASVSGDDLDLAIASWPISDANLVVRRLFTEPLRVGMRSDHPLARKEEISQTDLHDARFVVLHEMHCLGRQLIDLCHESGFHPKICCRSAQIATVQAMISSVRGISLLPELAVETDVDRGRVYRPLADARAQRTLVVFHHRGRHRSRLVEGMLRIIEESAAQRAARSRGAPDSAKSARVGNGKVSSRSG